jgi:hypothetical protein
MKRIVWLMAITLLGCNTKDRAPVPVVRAQPGDTQLSSLQFSMQVKSSFASSQAGMGLAADPPKVRVGYWFDAGGTLARYDLPAQMFPDGQARILLTNQQQTRLLLADTLRADKSLPDVLIDQLGSQLAAGFLDRAFLKKQTMDGFVAQSRTAAFDLVSRTSQQAIVERQEPSQQGQRRIRLTFDAAVGAVTHSEVVSVSTANTMKAISEIKYVQVQGLEDTTVPYEIKTTLNSQLTDNKLAAVELPTARQTLEPGTALQLGPGQTVVGEFTSPPGQGSLDPNKLTLEQTVTYQDIQVNAASQDFFLGRRP